MQRKSSKSLCSSSSASFLLHFCLKCGSQFSPQESYLVCWLPTQAPLFPPHYYLSLPSQTANYSDGYPHVKCTFTRHSQYKHAFKEDQTQDKPSLDTVGCTQSPYPRCCHRCPFSNFHPKSTFHSWKRYHPLRPFNPLPRSTKYLRQLTPHLLRLTISYHQP